MNAPVRIFPIGELADLLHGSLGSKWKTLVLLRAYFDESGTHGGALTTALAGYVATKGVWKQVEENWKPELALFANKGVKTFHMSKCIRGAEEFERLDAFERRTLIERLSFVLRDADLHPIWSAVANVDWEQTVTDDQFLQRFPKPLDFCFEHVVHELWDWAKCNAGGELVAPVFAHSKEYHPRWSAIGRVYSAQEWYQKVLGPISFGFPAQVIPLQATDFVVHQINMDFEKVGYGEPTLANMGITAALANAVESKGTLGGGWTADALKLAVDRYKKTGKIL